MLNGWNMDVTPVTSSIATDLSDTEKEKEKKDTAFLWSIHEAVQRQTLQIGVSACGATAVVDVLKALAIMVTPETVETCVRTKLRRNNSALPDYLYSRSEAGASHQQLINGAEQASGGRVLGKFFGFHPPRQVNLVSWLASWIQQGAVPVATMNMQCGVAEGEEISDAWHHQLVFGVAPDAVFLTNPLDVVNAEEIQARLCSESVLLIRREDVLKRISSDSLSLLFSDHQLDPRWNTFNVEGQLRQMIEEEECEEGHPKMTHIKIPAAYSAGITLFALRESPVGQKLTAAAELPLL